MSAIADPGAFPGDADDHIYHRLLQCHGHRWRVLG
jgi:hypothetical protein